MRRPRRVSRHLARQPFRHPPYRALSSSRTRQVHSPSRTTPSRHDLVPPRRSSRQARGPSRALAALLAVVVRLRPRATANMAYGALRCVVDRSTGAALQRGTRSALSVLPSRRALRPGNVACGDSDCGAPYHRVITRASTILLARPLARLARRPILGPVTTAVAPPGDRPRKALSAAFGPPER